MDRRSRSVRALLALLAAGCAEATVDPLQLPGREPSTTARFHFRFGRTPQDARTGDQLGQAWLEVRDGDALHTDPLPVTLRARRSDGGREVLVGTVESDAGIATFPTFALSETGVWVVTASGPDAATATSPPFTISSGASGGLHLRFDTQPQDTASGQRIRPDIVVSIVDAAGVVANRDALISVDVMRGDVTIGAPSSARAVRGTATFARIITDAWGTGFTLRAYAPELGTTRSEPFDVGADDVELRFSEVPRSALVGQPIVPLVVRARPARGQAGPWLTDEITLSGPGLEGTLTQRMIDGAARFTDVRSSVEGRIELVARGPGGSTALSGPILIRAPARRVLLPDGTAPLSATYPSLSHDGRFLAVVLASPAPGGSASQGVYILDRTLGSTMLASVDARGTTGNNWESAPHLTADGRFVAWTSGSTDLVVPDDNGFVHDVLARDLDDRGTTARVGITPDGQPPLGASIQGAAVSDDHRWLVFLANLSSTESPTVFLRDLSSATATPLGSGWRASLSGDGRVVVVETNLTLTPDDGQGPRHVIAVEPGRGVVEHLCVHADGIAARPLSGAARLSRDGNIVAFVSDATDLVPGDTNATWDVFVRDRAAGVTTRANVSSSGAEARATPGRLPHDLGSSGSSLLALSADGRFVVFSSTADNLVDDRIGGGLFVHDRRMRRTTRVLLSDTTPDDTVMDAAISGDGAVIAVSTWASNVLPGDVNGAPDTYVVGNPLLER